MYSDFLFQKLTDQPCLRNQGKSLTQRKTCTYTAQEGTSALTSRTPDKVKQLSMAVGKCGWLWTVGVHERLYVCDREHEVRLWLNNIRLDLKKTKQKLTKIRNKLNAMSHKSISLLYPFLLETVQIWANYIFGEQEILINLCIKCKLFD